jgi:hypothetical protein
MSFGGGSPQTVEQVPAAAPTTPDVKPVTDPQGMANWLAAGLQGKGQNSQDVGLSQQIALGTGQAKKRSLFASAPGAT